MAVVRLVNRLFTRRTWIVGLTRALALLPFRLQPQVEPAWIWSGAVTDRSVVVKAAFDDPPLPVPALLVSRERTLSNPVTVAGRATDAPSRSRDDRVVVEYPVTGLDPTQEYFAGFSERSGTRVRWRTFAQGAFSFTAAFASCAGGTRIVPPSHVSDSGVFDAIGALDPHLFVHMGDLHYYNILGPSRPPSYLLGMFRQALDRVLSQERQALLYRRTPLAYTWDDHDYGPNDSDGRSSTRNAARAYYDSDVPHYPLPLSPHADGPIAQVFDVGRVRFVMTDGRSERRPDRRTMLGPIQLSWLLAELERAAGDRVPLLVWVNSVPWITDDGDSDGWGEYAAERKAIGERITSLGLGSRLLMLSGDAHMLAFDDGRHNKNGGFIVAQAAPLDRYLRDKGGPYSHDPPSQANGQFGILRVDDDGDAITAAIEGHRYTGNGGSALVPGMVIRVRCAGDRCELLPE